MRGIRRTWFCLEGSKGEPEDTQSFGIGNNIDRHKQLDLVT
jgi:hypothetical protein